MKSLKGIRMTDDKIVQQLGDLLSAVIIVVLHSQ